MGKRTYNNYVIFKYSGDTGIPLRFCLFLLEDIPLFMDVRIEKLNFQSYSSQQPQ